MTKDMRPISHALSPLGAGGTSTPERSRNGPFAFQTRTPSEIKSLHGLRGREHGHSVHPESKRRPAFLSGTDQVRWHMVRQAPCRVNDNLKGLWMNAAAGFGSGQISQTTAYHPWGTYGERMLEKDSKVYATYSEAMSHGAMFYTGRPCVKHPNWKRSVASRKCCYCHSEATLLGRDTVAHREQSLASYHANKEQHKEARAERRRVAYLLDSGKPIQQALEWQRKNRPKVRAYNARRRAALLLAMPSWAREGEHWAEIAKVYEACPRGYEVDHIVPLRGERVCGLHVSWNLQYLTKSENSSKGCKFHV